MLGQNVATDLLRLSRPHPRTLALGTGFALILGWALLGVGLDAAPFGDNVEQFNWSHGLQWGYAKHPPLPTWLLAAALTVLGPHWFVAHLLAAFCDLGTLTLTWFIARRLAGPRVANLTALIWGLPLFFNMRVPLFNHNTVLVLAVAALVCAVLEAIAQGRLGYWVAAGAALGLGLLSKYQMLIPLAGIGYALWRTGALRSRQHRRGVAVALTVAALITLPHLLWLIANQFAPLHYAGTHVVPMGGRSRLVRLLHFLVQQLRYMSPALVVLAISAGLSTWRYRPLRSLTEGVPRIAGDSRIWIDGLVTVPLLLVLVTGVTVGLRLQNHWGVQTLQFACIPLAIALSRWPIAWRPRAVYTVIALAHLALASTALIQLTHNDLNDWEGDSDRTYPARRLAEAAIKDWTAVTDCPLSYVSGPGFEAGVISLYNGGNAKVLENRLIRRSPWINAQDMQDRGSIVLYYDSADAPMAAARTGVLQVSRHHTVWRADTIRWAILAPQGLCWSAPR